jgi:hypothetical protein
MKLILCPKCQDVTKAGRDVDHASACWCGLSWAYYVDELNACYGGKAIPLVLANSDLANAIRNQPTPAGPGVRFFGYVVPKECDTFKKVKKMGDNPFES